MAIKIHVMSESPGLRPYARQLLTEARKALREIRKKISIDDIDVVLYENIDETIQEIGGIGGFTPNANLVLISLDPTNRNFQKVIADELRSTLAHELHHALRWKKPGYGVTLLEALVTEGLADHFDREVTGRSPRPWSIALSEKELQRMLRRARPSFHKPYDHAAWFFGSRKDRIPRWTGYSLGFYLVGLYLAKKPDLMPSDLFSKPAELFLS